MTRATMRQEVLKPPYKNMAFKRNRFSVELQNFMRHAAPTSSRTGMDEKSRFRPLGQVFEGVLLFQDRYNAC